MCWSPGMLGTPVAFGPFMTSIEGFGMSIRCGIRAIGGAMTAVRPGATLLLTLLLTSP